MQGCRHARFLTLSRAHSQSSPFLTEFQVSVVSIFAHFSNHSVGFEIWIHMEKNQWLQDLRIPYFFGVLDMYSAWKLVYIFQTILVCLFKFNV